MADISKCANTMCPLRKKCYRFTAKAERYQSYADFKYDNGCVHFWSNNKKGK